MSQHTIQTLAQLESLYGPVGEASTRKEVSYVHPLYRALIEARPSQCWPQPGLADWMHPRVAIPSPAC